jgi:hypothetical protein
MTLGSLLARIIHEIMFEEQASPVVVRRLLTTLSNIEGRPLGLYV